MNLDSTRRWASVFCGVGFLTLATWWLALVIRSDSPHPIIGAFAVVLVTFGIGLFMGWRWAGRGAAFVLVLWAIFVPVGVLNPFMSAIILVQAVNAPLKLLWLVTLEVALLGMAWLIDPVTTRKPA